jgi:hypothetical protein
MREHNGVIPLCINYPNPPCIVYLYFPQRVLIHLTVRQELQVGQLLRADGKLPNQFCAPQD